MLCIYVSIRDANHYFFLLTIAPHPINHKKLVKRFVLRQSSSNFALQ